MPLDISLQRYGDAHFHKSVVTKLATATPQKPMDRVRKAHVDAGSVRGDPISAELRWSIREVTSYAGAQEITQANGLSPRGLRQAANRCNNRICLQNAIGGCGVGAVDAGARHLVIGSTPWTTRCFAAKDVGG